jgi:predicted transcriptional regulator
MATITVNVDDDVYEVFRKIASEEKRGKKGFLGDTITEAMKRYSEKQEQTSAV